VAACAWQDAQIRLVGRSRFAAPARTAPTHSWREVDAIVFVQPASVGIRSWAGERGQGLVEYGLILALIAIVAIAALTFLGAQVSGILGEIGQSV